MKHLAFIVYFFQIQDRAKYDPKVPGWINVYTVLHFVLVVFAFDDLSRYNLVICLVIYSKKKSTNIFDAEKKKPNNNSSLIY